MRKAQREGTTRSHVEASGRRTFGAKQGCRVEGYALRSRVIVGHGPTKIERGFDHASDTKHVGARPSGGFIEFIPLVASWAPCAKHPAIAVPLQIVVEAPT